MTLSAAERSQAWPSLPLDAWSDTAATLHMWLQIVGKVRLVQSPWINHSWHVTLYVTGRGLSTSPISHGARTFQVELDFVGHEALLSTSDGGIARVALRPQSVAEFYRRLMEAMAGLGVPVRIRARPNEIPDPVVPFDQDEAPRAYDPEYANRFWRVLVQADRVFKTFRARFVGKCSPVHFFWGAPDLAVTRFSGRPAPQHPGGVPNLPDRVAREAYSHEVSSCGFWAGGGPVPYPVFYSYAYPEPPGFAESKVGPGAAFYSSDLREFLLPYDTVRESESPDDTLLEFLQTTYEAAANTAKWDRESLERPRGLEAVTAPSLRFDVNDAELRETFFRRALFEALAGLRADAKPAWGRMTSQQMVEHLEWLFALSMGRPEAGCTVPEARRERFKRFLYDDTPMPRDIENPALVAGLPPLRHGSLPEAGSALRAECDGFLEWARSAPAERHAHPVFGPIGAEEWSRSHFKHAYHHLLQFGLV